MSLPEENLQFRLILELDLGLYVIPYALANFNDSSRRSKPLRELQLEHQSELKTSQDVFQQEGCDRG